MPAVELFTIDWSKGSNNNAGKVIVLDLVFDNNGSHISRSWNCILLLAQTLPILSTNE